MASSIPNLNFNSNLPMGQNFSPSVSGGNYSASSIFMQPMGNIYGLSNSNEVGNIPIIGGGVSLGLCLSEGTMYLKTMQNNGPVLLGYKISPLENSQSASSSGQPLDGLKRIEQILQSYDSRFSKIEEKLDLVGSEPKKGGKPEWQI